MTSAIELLAEHDGERDHLIARITDGLVADERIVAAGLTSSVARGEADGLSDLDIVVVFRDEDADDFVPARRREVERFGDVVWCQEVVGNAPPGGAYLGVGYTGIGYPQWTDWCWQPASLAVFPTPTLVLVEKSPITRSEHAKIEDVIREGRAMHPPPEQSPDFTPSDPVAALWTFKLAMFWRMSGVAASALARNRRAGAEWVMTNLATDLSELTGEPRAATGDGFERLRALCAYAEALVDRARSLGAMIPDDRSWVTDTIDFMEALVLEGWESPKP
jgi:predicted nucleotidyltransferase